jgi:hypothetical protein
LNKEETLNLIGNIKLCLAKLEAITAANHKDPRIKACFDDVSRLCASYEAAEGVTLNKEPYSGDEMVEKKVISQSDKAAYETKITEDTKS